MDSHDDLEIRLNNILNEDNDTLRCPNCSALVAIDMQKQALPYSYDGYEFGMLILKTMVCSICKCEWMPKSIDLTEEMKGKIWPRNTPMNKK
jgi:C4-type Zn-finger protein